MGSGRSVAIKGAASSAPTNAREPIDLLSLSRGRMLVREKQQAAEIDDADAIEMQALDCGASGRRQTQHRQLVFAPAKMLRPLVLARVKQWDALVCRRIDGFSLDRLQVIALLAGKSEIVRRIIAAS